MSSVEEGHELRYLIDFAVAGIARVIRACESLLTLGRPSSKNSSSAGGDAAFWAEVNQDASGALARLRDAGATLTKLVERFKQTSLDPGTTSRFEIDRFRRARNEMVNLAGEIANKCDKFVDFSEALCKRPPLFRQDAPQELMHSLQQTRLAIEGWRQLDRKADTSNCQSHSERVAQATGEAFRAMTVWLGALAERRGGSLQ
jgi:hypothetical protein